MAESTTLSEERPPLAEAAGAAEGANNGVEGEGFSRRVDFLVSKADDLEKKVNEVVNFYENNNKQSANIKGITFSNKDKSTNSGSNSNSKDVVCSKRMQDLMKQFGKILQQITNHKWAWPFMEPVDVKTLGLDDYYEVIKKPMDFGTIQNRMEAKDETRYKNVREIYSDVRLVFTNAMTYNDERNDIHVMAKTLLDKFEEKWLQLLPKVIEEENRQQEEDAQVAASTMLAQEANIARLARDTDNELYQLNLHLDELRQMVIERCRKMTTEEKRRLGTGLSNLSAEDLNKALEIIAQDNPTFQNNAEEVDLDMDAQSEITLWRLKFFVKEALEQQAKNSATKTDDTSKRKREICDAIAKSAKRRNKKQSP